VRDLTFRERKFCNLILLGKTKREAYAEAFSPRGTPNKIRERARIVSNRPVVVAYIAAEQAKTAESIGLTRAQKRRVLMSIALDTKEDAGKRIAAIQTDNVMTGDNKPVRFEGEITLAGIFMSLQKTTGLPDPNEVHELESMSDTLTLTP
jgi:hypothetical protein